MNGERYLWLVESLFSVWHQRCFGDAQPVHLIHDHERCLWLDYNIRALEASGCRVLHQFPKSSPDLNAIEGWWHRLCQRLEDTTPVTLETRTAFLVRLRHTVHWMNEHCRADALYLATNQKERAREVTAPELAGAKPKW